jgi:hypothetical protein
VDRAAEAKGRAARDEDPAAEGGPDHPPPAEKESLRVPAPPAARDAPAGEGDAGSIKLTSLFKADPKRS